MKELITIFLQTLVRTIFGAFIGGFFGLVMGGFIEVMQWIEKRSFQELEEIALLVVIGAVVGGLLGASNTLGVSDTKTNSRNGRGIGGNEDGDGSSGGDGGGNGG